MNIEYIRQSWKELLDEYREYFTSNEEEWYIKLLKTKEYMDTHNKRPSAVSRDKYENFLGSWITSQNQNFIKNIKRMKNEEIRESWEEFITDIRYRKYFLSNEEEWYINLQKTKEYIDTHNKRPSEKIGDSQIISIGRWVTLQISSYKTRSQIMKNENIRKAWQNFIESYPHLFNSS
jgi:hypothetical protein